MNFWSRYGIELSSDKCGFEGLLMVSRIKKLLLGYDGPGKMHELSSGSATCYFDGLATGDEPVIERFDDRIITCSTDRGLI